MRVALKLACALAVFGCGRSEPARSVEPGTTSLAQRSASSERESAKSTGPEVRASAAEIEVEGEVGGLDQELVDRSVQAATGDIDRCFDQGVARNRLVSGSIHIVLGVGRSGRAAYGYVKHSALGDGQTERCMVDALSKRTYPKPVGGKVGVVRATFSFELEAARPPIAWTSARVSDAIGNAASEIAACKVGTSAPFTATMYLEQVELPPPPPVDDADAGDAGDAGDDVVDAGPTFVGRVISVGIAAPDERSFAAVPCLERVLGKLTYATPGSWPAKVTFEL